MHMTLMRNDFAEYWINATWFKGDRIITPEMMDKLKRTGGFSNIVDLRKNEGDIAHMDPGINFAVKGLLFYLFSFDKTNINIKTTPVL